MALETEEDVEAVEEDVEEIVDEAVAAIVEEEEEVEAERLVQKAEQGSLSSLGDDTRASSSHGEKKTCLLLSISHLANQSTARNAS